MVELYLIFGFLILAIIIVCVLFAIKAPPFNQPYKFVDPRTWQSVENNKVWLTPEYDFGSYTKSVPTPEVSQMYESVIKSLKG